MGDAILAEIRLFAFGFAPVGWLVCEGQQLGVNANAALYSLIGNVYGRNTTNFNIPNLKGAEPIVGMKYYIAVQGEYPSRQ